MKKQTKHISVIGRTVGTLDMSSVVPDQQTYSQQELYRQASMGMLEKRASTYIREHSALMRTVQQLADGTLTTTDIPFTKSRAIRMANAITHLETGSKHGNLHITFDGTRFLFTYRDTPILDWHLALVTAADIYAPMYEGKESTVYQRTSAREAVYEFRQLAIERGLS